MLDRYEIDNLEQLRAISDMLRVRILDLLRERPMTVTQLGELLSSASDNVHYAPAKVHYHVRELEKVGLLRLVETREKGGILEKYYQPIAREIAVSPGLLLSVPPDEAMAAIGGMLEQIKHGFLGAFRKALAKKETLPNLAFANSRLYLTLEEHKQLCQQVNDLLKSYEKPRSREGEQEIQSVFMLYPETASLTPVVPESQESGKSIEAPSDTEKNWTVGFVRYSRADLEKVVAQGKRLYLNVVGICSIARDVSPDLAEQAIEKISLVGKLKPQKTSPR
ncbi:MAG TPA: helix-turn-helix domain-containing protein [Ktedonosporobacter sp.]|nr:helix-turn-helix domain-containing protein [Ktedonosporobacter sp.]